ncbi:cache domain-containing protein [Geobacter pelophilus]|uniref:histidine kinase n=1 Tax=Geoanaerobacter pelophilus TaxID=60036 RepID=A0AAW4L2F1_9BACT|nr:cache domain-containing protein [Geoanaerobacter pelophilus]MBT0665118.1 cache domain-containing protein [Geoanaerobacter pelophilus]
MRRYSIRTKLTVGALTPFFVALIVCSLTGLYIIDSRIAHQAQEKVRTDLNSAREAYQNELARIDELVQLTGSLPYSAAAVASGDPKAIQTLLLPLQKRQKLDFLTVVDRNGRVLYRAHNPAHAGDDIRSRRSVALALQGQAVRGTELFTSEELMGEQQELASRATIEAVATPRARPSPMTVEHSGMLLVAAAPVLDANGVVVGALTGGVLLNRNNALVDKIKDTVYEGVKFNNKDVGTATIFLGDLRIATNVMTPDNRRAIGTRLSEEVYKRVIVEKAKWVGKAFVVTDWYLTAYEPILDLGGEPVGSLYVGMLEKPYAELKKEVNLIFGAVVLICTLAGLAISGFIGRQLSRPVKDLEQLARRVAAGERDLQIEVRTADELEDLADEFNQMTRALDQRETEVRDLNRSLEQKVHERTAQLEEQSRLLLQTQTDLARAAKLADLGVMAAGVAHEINTPLAIIRGNTEVLEMGIPPEHPNREEIDIISRQTERMAKIVGNLLTFAREKKLRQGSVAIHALLDDIVAQIGFKSPMSGITVTRNYDPELVTVPGDGDQLRQVFSNLILNAVQSMPSGGVLTLTTSRSPGGDICMVDVADTGCGISGEDQDKIFSPFFTTKESGSGLGLSVSYGIVKDHGGEICVNSAEGEGAVFRVSLSIAPQGKDSAAQE